MRAVPTSLVADEELNDLKLRLELLEGDRKAYYETSQFAIRQNKDVITQLRSNIKELGDRVVRFKKEECDPRSSRMSMVVVERVEQKVCEIHKRYDDLQAEARAKADRLREKRDKLAELRTEAAMMKAELEESGNACEIRALENRLDKALIKHGEAQSIRKTYDQVVRHMQEERLLFDRQLAAAERSIKAKKLDAADLDLMSSDASHARDVTKAEQARIEAQINDERELRAAELQALKEVVKAKVEEREAELKVVQPFAAGVEMLAAEVAEKAAVDEDRERRMGEYEEIVRTLKEVMGVSNLDEVLVKFKGQKETDAHLRALQRAGERRFEELNARHAEAARAHEEVLFSGESRRTAAQRMIADLERHGADVALRAQDAKVRDEKIQRLLVNVKSGVQHALDKLEGITVSDAQPNLKLTDSTIVLAMDTMARKLETLYKSVTSREQTTPPRTPSSAAGAGAGGAEQAEAAAAAAAADEEAQSAPGDAGQLPAVAEAEEEEATAAAAAPAGLFLGGPSPIVTIAHASILPPNNCRVKLRPPEFETDTGADEEEDAADEHVLTREALKKHTTQLLNSRVKKPAKKAKKKAKADAAELDE